MYPDTPGGPAHPGLVESDGHLRRQCDRRDGGLPERAQCGDVSGQLGAGLEGADDSFGTDRQFGDVAGEQASLIDQIRFGAGDTKVRPLKGESGVRPLLDGDPPLERRRRRRGGPEADDGDGRGLAAVASDDRGRQSDRCIGLRSGGVRWDRDGEFLQHRRQEVGDGARWRRLPGEVDRTVDQSQRVRGVKAGSRVGDGVGAQGDRGRVVDDRYAGQWDRDRGLVVRGQGHPGNGATILGRGDHAGANVDGKLDDRVQGDWCQTTRHRKGQFRGPLLTVEGQRRAGAHIHERQGGGPGHGVDVIGGGAGGCRGTDQRHGQHDGAESSGEAYRPESPAKESKMTGWPKWTFPHRNVTARYRTPTIAVTRIMYWVS